MSPDCSSRVMKVPVPVKGSRMCTPSSERLCRTRSWRTSFGGAEDEVDDLDRRVDDARADRPVLAKASLEELLVQLGDDLLLALGAVDARGAKTRRSRRSPRGVCVSASSPWPSRRVEHRLHDLGDGVVRGEVVAREQGVEHRPGDQVLGRAC